MKFFRFIAWWWKSMKYSSKAFIVIGPLSVLLGAISSTFAATGFGFGVFMLTFTSVFVLAGVVASIIYLLISAWDKYNTHLEEEADEIARLLRG